MTTTTRLAFLLAMIAAFVGSSLVAHGQEPKEGTFYAPNDLDPSPQPGGDDRGNCDQGSWSYNGSCCCTAKWCHPIDARFVRMNGPTFIVAIPPGGHPNLPHGGRWTFEEKRADWSPDGRFHLCASGLGGPTVTPSASCLLIGAGGS